MKRKNTALNFDKNNTNNNTNTNTNININNDSLTDDYLRNILGNEIFDNLSRSEVRKFKIEIKKEISFQKSSVLNMLKKKCPKLENVIQNVINNNNIKYINDSKNDYNNINSDNTNDINNKTKKKIKI